MKIRILKNALAHGRRFVEGEAVEVSEATGALLMSAGLAVQTGGDGATAGAETQTDGDGATAGAETQTDGDGATAGAETQTDGAGETAADKPKRGRGRNKGGAKK